MSCVVGNCISLNCPLCFILLLLIHVESLVCREILDDLHDLMKDIFPELLYVPVYTPGQEGIVE